MKYQILFVSIFLVCASVSENEKLDNPSPVSTNNTNSQQLQNSGHSVEPANQKPSTNSVVSGDGTNNSNVKATTPRIVENTDVPHSHSDASDLIGDSMFSRAAFLLTGISVLILFYFAWRSFSLRRRQTHIHKYGVVASREDLEMTSLGFGSEDEDDDTTHFDIGKHQIS